MPTQSRDQTREKKTNSRITRPRPLTILIVDDEPAAINRTKAIFVGTEYRVIACENGVAALALLKTERVDCIIADIIMPVMDGSEMIRKIRANDQIKKDLPIIVVSRKRQRTDVAAALEAGATDYILKPIDDQVFLDKIESNIHKGQAKRHVFEHLLYGESFSAEIKIEARVSAISEADITLGLSSPVSIDTKVSLISQVFQQIGINPPILRLVHCRKVPPGGASSLFQYEARYAFMGIPEEDSRMVRSWLHKQAIERRK